MVPSRHFHQSLSTSAECADAAAVAFAQAGGNENAISDEMLDRIEEMQLVETVSLLPGLPENGFQCDPPRPGRLLVALPSLTKAWC